jgi:hypothetical protein
MKKVTKKMSDGMRSKYRFDYTASKPNRFAPQIKEGSVAVLLDPDVAAVFVDSKSVNQFLRAVIAAMFEAPKSRKKRTTPKRDVSS